MTEELYHHGILGQKWGVRRTPAQLGHVKNSSKNSSGASDTGTKGKSFGGSERSSDLSDDELRRRISRMNLEEQYDNLLEKRGKQESGWLKTTLTKNFKDAAERFAAGATAKLVDKGLNKLFKKGNDLDEIKDLDSVKDSDLMKMDPETLKKVKNMWTDYATIVKLREPASPKTEKPEKTEKKEKTENTENTEKTEKTDEAEKPKKEKKSRFGFSITSRRKKYRDMATQASVEHGEIGSGDV